MSWSKGMTEGTAIHMTTHTFVHPSSHRSVRVLKCHPSVHLLARLHKRGCLVPGLGRRASPFGNVCITADRLAHPPRPRIQRGDGKIFVEKLRKCGPLVDRRLIRTAISSTSGRGSAGAAGYNTGHTEC